MSNEDQPKAFRITRGKGFHIRFANGFAVSVQWGPGNYGDHYHEFDFNAPKRADVWESNEAEVAVFKPDGEFMHSLGRNDSVLSYQTPNEVLELMVKVAALDPRFDPDAEPDPNDSE